jgi:hypothetical protein
MSRHRPVDRENNKGSGHDVVEGPSNQEP